MIGSISRGPMEEAKGRRFPVLNGVPLYIKDCKISGTIPIGFDRLRKNEKRYHFKTFFLLLRYTHILIILK